MPRCSCPTTRSDRAVRDRAASCSAPNRVCKAYQRSCMVTCVRMRSDSSFTLGSGARFIFSDLLARSLHAMQTHTSNRLVADDLLANESLMSDHERNEFRRLEGRVVELQNACDALQRDCDKKDVENAELRTSLVALRRSLHRQPFSHHRRRRWRCCRNQTLQASLSHTRLSTSMGRRAGASSARSTQSSRFV